MRVASYESVSGGDAGLMRGREISGHSHHPLIRPCTSPWQITSALYEATHITLSFLSGDAGLKFLSDVRKLVIGEFALALAVQPLLRLL
jgi:hypothetical protein